MINLQFPQYGDLEASILSDVFHGFPKDLPDFFGWLKDNSIALFKTKSLYELAVGPLEPGKSKIAKPTEVYPSISTIEEAIALDYIPGLPSEALAKEGEIISTSTPAFTVLDNRLSALENVLVDQIALVKAELTIQKQTILGLAKLVPIHPISTVVVQGSPATLTTYSIAPQVQTGFDRLSASYLNLSNDAVINGSLTVRSGASLNSLSVSGNGSIGGNLSAGGDFSLLGNASISGNATIGGALSVTGDTTLVNLTITGIFNAASSSVIFANASTTYLTVSDTGWINNGVITNASTTYLTVGSSAFFPGSGIWNSSGNVGIGTLSPSEALEVTGNIKASQAGKFGNLIADNNGTYISATSQGVYGFGTQASGGAYPLALASGNGTTRYTGTSFTDTGGGAFGITYYNGFFWITSYGPRIVYKYNTNGTYTGTSFSTVSTGDIDGILYYNGFFWISNYNGGIVYKYNTDGTYTGVNFSTSGNGNTGPTGLEFYNGFFWIIDYPGAKVYKYNTDGTYTGTSFSTSGSGNTNATGISYYNGFFWISDFADAKVYQYTTDGIYTGVNFSTSGSGNTAPMGMTFYNNFFWVADNNQNVYKYYADLSSGGYFTFSTDGGERMRIDSNGYVSIATTTIPAGFGLNVATSTFIYGNQFVSGGLGVGVATTTSGSIQTSGDVFVGRNLYVSGNSTTIGQSSSDILVVNSSVGSDLVPTLNNWYNLGSPSFYWHNLYIDTLNANNISGASTTISGTKSNDFTINTDNASIDQENMNLIFYRGMVPPNAVIGWNAATSSKRFEFNQAARFFNESASTTNPVLTVQGNTGLTANAFQVLDVSTSTVLFSVNPVSQNTTMANASTTNLTVSSNLWANNGTITNASTTNLTVSGNLWTGASSFLNIGGTLLLADGSVGAPSLAFTNDTNTGLYRPGSGQLGLVTGGYNALTIKNNQYVGIGNTITDPQAQLEVGTNDVNNNTIVDVLRLDHYTTGTADNGLGAGILFYGQNSLGAGQNMARIASQVEHATTSEGFLANLSFWTVGSSGLLEKMRLTANGQLLLATTTVPSGFGANIATSTYIYGSLQVGTSSLKLMSGNIISDSGQFNITNAANTALTFSTNNAEAMRIDSSGRVGIGTSTPDAKLNVVGDTAGYELIADFKGGTSLKKLLLYGDAFNDNSGTFLFQAPSGIVLDGAGSNTQLDLNSNGKVGIGTTSPQFSLEVGYSNSDPVSVAVTNAYPNSGAGSYAQLLARNGYSSDVDAIRILVMGTGWTTTGGFVQDSGVLDADTGLSGGLSIMTRANAPIRFYTNGQNERMRIDENGNVGIGTTTPAIRTV